MKVSQAVAKRKSIRAFTSDPVSTRIIIDCLKKASRSPSGGNVQPWKIVVINNQATERFRSIMAQRINGIAHPDGEAPEYDVYPPKLIEPYRTARYEVGEDMYNLLGIDREDKAARRQWFANNYQLFGAPAAIFCFMDRTMLAPQWSDCGMFLQTFMLLLEEAGIQSCAQECWYNYPKTVSQFCRTEENLMLFCGVAIGHEDRNHPVNQLKTKRLQESQWLSIIE